MIEYTSGSLWWDFDGQAVFVLSVPIGPDYEDAYFLAEVQDFIRECADAWQSYAGMSTQQVLKRFSEEYKGWHEVLPINRS